MIEAIKLNQLAASPVNIRKTGTGGIAELAESIKRDGLLQNLTVVESGGAYEVVAGGRRLAALQLLAKQKVLPKDHPVPCLVVAANDAEAVSLAENQLREAMHPVDQLMAFTARVDAGDSITDLAARFGVTEAFIKQRMKLAKVSPKLLDECRNGSMTLEKLQAFSVTDDHFRQEALWDEVKDDRWTDADDIKNSLLSETVSCDDFRLKFVGMAAYQKAGGAIIAADLFAQEDEVADVVSDPELLDRMVTEKLAKKAAKLKKDEGLAFVETAVSWFDRDNIVYATTRQRTPSPAERKALDDLEAQYNALDDDEDYDRIGGELDDIEEKINALNESLEEPHPDEAEHVGAAIILQRNGVIRIERNLIHKSHKAKPNKQAGADAGEGESESEQQEPTGYSEKITRRLTAHKTAILRRQILRTDDAVTVLLLHMLVEDYGIDFGLYGGCLEMTTSSPTNLAGLAEDITESKAMTEFNEIEESLLSGIKKCLANAEAAGEDPQAALFQYLLKISESARMDLLTLCVANRVDVVTGHVGNPAGFDGITGHFIDDAVVAEYWQPTCESLLSSVPKSQVIAAVTEARSADEAAKLATMKKSEAAEAAEQMLAGTGWLPGPMRIRAGE